jgi:hypothetical protein
MEQQKMIAAIFAIVVVASAAHAEPLPPDKPYIIMGGGSSCGTWTQARQSKSVNAKLYEQWVAGYLSGKNAQTSSFNAQNDPL